MRFVKDLVRYPLGREGVFAPGGCVCLTLAMGRVINIVGLSAISVGANQGWLTFEKILTET